MSTQSFAELGVSSAVVDALVATRHHRIRSRSRARDRRRPRRSRRARRNRRPARARRSPSASRWSSASHADAAAARGAGARADARARDPDRRRAPRRSRTPARCGSPPSTAASACSSRPRTPPRSHILVATPGRLEDLLARGAFSLDDDPDARARRGRPHARHGLPPGRRPDRRRCPRDAPDAVLLGHARRRGRTRGAGATRATRSSTSRRAGRPARRERRRAPLRRGRARAPRRRARRRAARASATSTLVFVRTKRGADRLVKRLGDHGVDGRRDARQQVPAPARAGARAVRVRRTSTRSSRPTSPPAASTSSGISHVINFDPPADRDTYVHRIGRTGRAGAQRHRHHAGRAVRARDVSRLAAGLGLDHGLGGTGAERRTGAAPRTGQAHRGNRAGGGSHRRSGNRRAAERG